VSGGQQIHKNRLAAQDAGRYSHSGYQDISTMSFTAGRGLARLSMVCNPAFLRQTLNPIAAGRSVGRFFQAHSGTINTVGKGMALVSAGYAAKDTYTSYAKGEISGPQAAFSGAAAACGALSGFSPAYGFAFALYGSMFTMFKYGLGGAKAMKDRNNQMDIANTVFAHAVAIPSFGAFGTPLGIVSGAVSLALSNAACDHARELKGAALEMVEQGQKAPEQIKLILTATLDRFDPSITCVVADDVFGGGSFNILARIGDKD
jgi:hypothetical protein